MIETYKILAGLGILSLFIAGLLNSKDISYLTLTIIYGIANVIIFLK